MIDSAVSKSEREDPKKELTSYCIGGVLALLLTGAAFAIVATQLLQGTVALFVLAGLAILQIAVHLKFFLHIDLKKSHRDDLQLVLFTFLILAIMVGGTIWILFNQHARMM